MQQEATVSRRYLVVKHDCLCLNRRLSQETEVEADLARVECSDKSVARLLTAFAESLLLLASHQHRRMTFPGV